MKKNSFKILTFTLLAVTILAAASHLSTTAEQAGNWTNDALAKYSDDYSYYRVLDVDGDGSNELFLSNNEGTFFADEDDVLLLTQVDGEIKKVADFAYPGGFKLYFNAQEHRLTYMTRCSGEVQAMVYALDDEHLKEMTLLEYYAPNHNPRFDTESSTYYVDLKATDKTTYDLYESKYMNDTYELKLHEINK